jgi:hypothetical protein
MRHFSRIPTFFLLISSAVMIGCTKAVPTAAPERIQLDSTLAAPISELIVPIMYPVQELEDMANEKLNGKIIEARLAISKGNDSLFLSISRFKPLELWYDGDRGLTYKIPVQIDGFIDSKVVGIKIKNKTPVHAKIIMTLFSDLYMDPKWDLLTKTEIKKIEWVEEPKLNVAGIKFNLKPPIEKALESNKEKIIQKLDQSTGDLVKIRQSIDKLWGDIQKPITINRKVVPVWLKGDAENMDGRLIRESKDTLMIEVGLYAAMSTTLDSAASIKDVKPLPAFKQKKNETQGLNAFVHITLPFDKLNSFINTITDTMKFDYGNHKVQIESAEIYGTPEGIAIRVSTKGDLKADLYLRGTIGFDSLQKKVVIENFAFDVNTEQSLVSAADWFAHDQILDRIRPYLTLPVNKTFDAIPQLIIKGIEKGKLGKKIDLRFSELDVNIYQYIITTKNIQLIVSAKGYADITLQKGLFNKKKKVTPPA